MFGNDTSVSLPVADCSFCPFRGKTLLMGRCMPGDTCVIAESGRQIDRFFRINPVYAPQYLKDSFWERRAIAVRHDNTGISSIINKFFFLPKLLVTCLVVAPSFPHISHIITRPLSCCVKCMHQQNHFYMDEQDRQDKIKKRLGLNSKVSILFILSTPMGFAHFPAGLRLCCTQSRR